MEWLWIGLAVVGVLVVGVLAFLVGLHVYVVRKYMRVVGRIFQEKPFFILPFGQPQPDAEQVTLTTSDGLKLLACYLKARSPRKGVILFGLEFGSNRWSCVPYTEFLRDAGYDIFAFEMRGQGQSPAQPGYEPLQWVTDCEVIDFEAAVAHLKNRPDRDERGAGFFGLSKGGGAGLMVAAREPFLRCFVTDGIFATLTTMVPYMKQWIFIYITYKALGRLVPRWYYRLLARKAISRVAAERQCRYPPLEKAMPHLAPRPFLMIHGGADTYIKPDMARTLFDMASQPKELWVVEGAKHNQGFTLAGDEYRRRVLAFFDKHLAAPPGGAGSSNGAVAKDATAKSEAGS